MNWFPLHCHSTFSLLDGLSQPNDIAKRCAELGYAGSAISDHGGIAGATEFVKAMKAKNIKPILGNEFYISQQDCKIKDSANAKHSHLVVLAKSLEGWKNLIRATSYSNQPECFYRKPRLDLKSLGQFSDELIAFSGHPGSDLSNAIFADLGAAFRATTYEEAKACVDSDWVQKVTEKLYEYLDVFSKDRFFIEIQLIDRDRLPMSQITADGLRYIAKKEGVRTVATADSHYPTPEDADDQRVILCTAMETTLKEVKRKLAQNEDVGLGGFFQSRNYHIPTLAEMQALHTDAELENSLVIADMCEDYDILGSPILPNFPCPNNISQIDYLKQLCRDGWKDKIVPHVSKNQHFEYADRVKMELGVIEEAGLAGYFLIVQDYINFARQEKQLVGPGRGSSAGSLVAYLCGITNVDPIPYNLLFSRFYNASRKGSLPDIDSDFPKAFRGPLIRFLKEKYGAEHVSQISTFGAMKGRGALKDVLRVHEACSFDEMNLITSHIPDESKISDDLQVMEQEEGESSIIKWALENNAEDLKEWCFIDDNGKLQGRFSRLFEQAIRLEGCKRSRGKHASGVVISPKPLAEMVPLTYDKETKETICGMEFTALESMGLVKFDILGISLLDKLMDIENVQEFS